MNSEKLEMEIFTYPDSVLKTTAEPVENIDGSLQTLIDRMLETMYIAPGVGLAANQVGVLKRLIVYDASPREQQKDPAVLINPEILFREGEIKWDEACLSVPDYSAEVLRNARVQVNGLDRHGEPVHVEAEQLLAVCLQHEIDHLNGILFIDHISSLKRALYKKKVKKKKQKASD